MRGWGCVHLKQQNYKKKTHVRKDKFVQYEEAKDLEKHTR